MIQELSPAALRSELAGQTPPVVIDVREGWEWAIGHLAGSRHVPLATLPGALVGLDQGARYVLLCHHGVRSLHAARYMEAQGFGQLANLTGGIEAWSRVVDPAIARY